MMNPTSICKALLAVLAGLGISATAERGPTATPEVNTSDSRQAIERALPYLARQTASWIEQYKCTSCHQVPHALWAMNEAHRLGFAVDDRLPKWNRWSVEFVISKAEGVEGTEPLAREKADELSQLLLARATDFAESQAESKSTREQLIALLQRARHEDGQWRAGGQLPDQKRPKPETDEATSMWSALALGDHGAQNDFPVAFNDQSRVAADARSSSLEHLGLRYLMARANRNTSAAAELGREILSHQNDDGGWGWLLDGASDALGTGHALYALTQPKEGEAREAIRRAREFLIRAQEADGSWRVPSTLAGHAGPYVVSNDWGTAWAVIGLMKSQNP